MELIKTGPVTGTGQLAAGTYTRYYGDGDGLSAITTVLSGNGITVVQPTCSVEEKGPHERPFILAGRAQTPAACACWSAW